MTGYGLLVTDNINKIIMARNTAYRNLDVYKESKRLVLEVYALIKKFPSEERFAMCDQLRRSVTSVPSNIAEGFGRISPKEQVHFIEIAYGSLMEVETQLDIAADLAYISKTEFDNISETTIQNIAKMLSGLRSRRLNNP